MDQHQHQHQHKHQHQFQSAHQPCIPRRRYYRNLDIPPRKLLSNRLADLSSEPSMEIYRHLQEHQHNYESSPRVRVLTEEAIFQKFLPNSGVDDDSDPYASDEFRIYEFKVRKCTRTQSHDWTECPFTHPGEKARRRCPRRFCYSGEMCPDYRRGYCARGDTCEFAHGVFEHWLHPSRYRTEACKDGNTCQRRICFFAHNSSQIRSVSDLEMVVTPTIHGNSDHCPQCRCHRGIHHTAVTPSPTSILDTYKMSPPSSPPFLPAQSGGLYSPISRFSAGMSQLGNDRNDVVTPPTMKELMHNMNVMKLNANDQASNVNPVWMDSFAACNAEQRLLFSPSGSTSGSGLVRPRDCNYAVNEVGFGNEGAIARPDLEWVNDLLT